MSERLDVVTNSDDARRVAHWLRAAFGSYDSSWGICRPNPDAVFEAKRGLATFPVSDSGVMSHWRTGIPAGTYRVVRSEKVGIYMFLTLAPMGGGREFVVCCGCIGVHAMLDWGEVENAAPTFVERAGADSAMEMPEEVLSAFVTVETE